jgi:hypothetical protein
MSTPRVLPRVLRTLGVDMGDGPELTDISLPDTVDPAVECWGVNISLYCDDVPLQCVPQ